MGKIPAGKFCPPLLDPARHLCRKRVIDQLLSSAKPPKRVILLQAQAGQGKSTFAAQLLSHLDVNSAWYQLGPEDGDPVLLLTALLSALVQNLPGFRAPVLEKMLENGVVGAPEAPGCVDRLLADLEAFLRDDFYLVLDDVYLLENAPFSLALLGRLLTSAPPRLHLVLISRPPILPVLQADFPADQALVIGTEELALNRNEIADLFNDILQRPVSVATVQALHRATGGWVMGLLLAANSPLAVNLPESAERLASSLAGDHGDALDYFASEVMDTIPRALRRTLAKLALLPQVPVALARELAEVGEVEAVLEDLERRNFFVRRLDTERSAFTFHHLFRDCLQTMLATEFGRAEIEETLNRAADWYLANGQPEDALRFYLRGQNVAAAQRVLRRVGMTLQAQNRIVTLQGALDKVPAEILRHSPWLAYFHGVVLVNTDPPAALPWFEAALTEFRRSGDGLGELMASVQKIHFHIAVDGVFNRCRPLFERATALFDALGDQLEPSQRANAANIFLLAFAVVSTELDKADQYLSLGLQLAREAGLENLEAEARMARCYRHIFAADYRACRREIERSLGLLGSPRVSAINKGALLLAHLNLLVNEGDFRSYSHHKALLRERLGEEVVDRSVFGAFIRLWDIDMDLRQGRFDEAREHLRQVLGGDYDDGGPHLRNQYLQYQAYLLALEGEAGRALEAAEEALALREEVGGPTFEMINAAIIGAAYARLGRSQKALELFDRGLEHSRVIGEALMRPSLHAFRAELRLRLGEEAAAHDDIRQMLALLEKRDHPHFYAWTPRLMARLLAEAVRNGIESDYARKLAAERLDLAILADGTPIPLLQLCTLGRFEIAVGGKVVLRSGDLTPAQRQLLALLLAAPERQLHQEEVQLALWPDHAPEKARSSLDTLLSRLRRTLDRALGAVSVKHYLGVHRGILRLENCRVDARDFAAGVRIALDHLRRGEVWQADNAFRSAMDQWQGEFLPGEPLEGAAEQRRHDLLLLYLEGAQRWGGMLADGGQTAAAIRVAGAGLRHDPTDDRLNRLLYNLHARQGNPGKARQVIRQYAEALRREDYRPEEVDEILESFWNAPA